MHICKKKDQNNKGDLKMKKNTIRNILFAILGAFLFGLGQDLNKYSIGTIGFYADVYCNVFSNNRTI